MASSLALRPLNEIDRDLRQFQKEFRDHLKESKAYEKKTDIVVSKSKALHQECLAWKTAEKILRMGRYEIFPGGSSRVRSVTRVISPGEDNMT